MRWYKSRTVEDKRGIPSHLTDVKSMYKNTEIIIKAESGEIFKEIILSHKSVAYHNHFLICIGQFC